MFDVPHLYFKIVIGLAMILYLTLLLWCVWSIRDDGKDEHGAGDATTRAALGNFGNFF